MTDTECKQDEALNKKVDELTSALTTLTMQFAADKEHVQTPPWIVKEFERKAAECVEEAMRSSRDDGLLAVVGRVVADSRAWQKRAVRIRPGSQCFWVSLNLPVYYRLLSIIRLQVPGFSLYNGGIT